MFKNKVVGLLKKEINFLGEEEILRLIESPPQPEFGDYAFPCFALASKFRKSPSEIASELAEKLAGNLPKEIGNVRAVNAYVNFFINKSLLSEQVLHDVLEKGEKYGSSNLGKGKKALVEHTSINPNASPHVGRARGALIGDSIVRALRFQGYKVEVHYYVNDVSKQVALLALSCRGNEKFERMLDLYVKAAKKLENKEFEKKIFSMLRRLEDNDKEIVNKFKKIVKTCVDGQHKILTRLGIKYDKFDYESHYLNKRLISILTKLEKTGRLFKDKEGRLVLDQSGKGLEKEMRQPLLVLTRSDGSGLYALRDLAYSIEKSKKADNNIIVLGEDQKLYFKQISKALELLGHKPAKAAHYSFVLILTSSGKKKMSTRKGDLVLLSDFIDEAVKKASIEIKKRKSKGDADAIGIAAVKYAILHTEKNKNVVFDWQQALNFEGNSGPYLQYAYARASSILRKAGKKAAGKDVDFSLLKDRKETALINHLALFPEACSAAVQKLSPHITADYSYRLAQLFNDFYETCPVLKASKREMEARLMLVRAMQQVLANSLSLLGIEVLERM